MLADKAKRRSVIMTRIVILAFTALMTAIVQPTTAIKAQSAGLNYAVANTSSVDPTANTGGVQAGLGLQLTPNGSGVVQIVAQATGKNGTVGGCVSLQI